MAVGLARIKVKSHPDVPKGYGGGGPEDVPVKVPARYTDLDTSGLTFEVRAGKQEHDINLTDELPPPSSK